MMNEDQQNPGHERAAERAKARSSWRLRFWPRVLRVLFVSPRSRRRPLCDQLLVKTKEKSRVRGSGGKLRKLPGRKMGNRAR